MGFKVDKAGLQAAETRLDGLSKDSEGVAALGKDADPEWYTWGLVGAPFAAWYGNVASEVHRDLTAMSEALKAHSDRIKFCRESYAGREEDTAAVMDKIKSRMKK